MGIFRQLLFLRRAYNDGRGVRHGTWSGKNFRGVLLMIVFFLVVPIFGCVFQIGR